MYGNKISNRNNGEMLIAETTSNLLFWCGKVETFKMLSDLAPLPGYAKVLAVIVMAQCHFFSAHSVANMKTKFKIDPL